MGNYSIFQKKYSIFLFYLFIIGAWIVWCLCFLNKGVDVTDEGYYCTEAWKLAHGALPFRDSPAAAGLSFWFLSLIFYVVPQFPLIGMRIIWALAMLLFALFTARILFRYFNPMAISIGVVIGLFFTATALNIKVLSYNNVFILGLLFTVWLWLDAQKGNGKIHLMKAAAAGLLALLSTLCRLTLLPILLLPVVTLAYDYLCNVKRANWPRLAMVYFGSFSVGLIIAILILFRAGILYDIPHSMALALEDNAGHSFSALLNNFLFSFRFYFAPALVTIFVVCIFRYKAVFSFAKLHIAKAALIASLIAIIVVTVGILSLIAWLKFAKGVYWPTSATIDLYKDPLNLPLGATQLLLVPLICILATYLVVHLLDQGIKAENGSHDKYCFSFMAIFLMILMITGTANRPAPTVMEIACIPVALSAGIICTWLPEWERCFNLKGAYTYALRIIVIFIAVFYATVGLLLARYPFRDSFIGDLTASPTSEKLSCIYTTAGRAQVIDRLVAAVKNYSNEDDRILAYDDIPMIYYLTDRLPAPSTSAMLSVGTNPDALFSIRKTILDDMINRNGLPRLVIKTTYSLRNPGWPEVKDSNGQIPENDPIDQFVNANYRVIENIDGFLIMIPRQG